MVRRRNVGPCAGPRGRELRRRALALSFIALASVLMQYQAVGLGFGTRSLGRVPSAPHVGLANASSRHPGASKLPCDTFEQGTVKGDDIAFVLNRPGASMSYEMKGTITGDAVAGQAMAMGATVDWSMARAK